MKKHFVLGIILFVLIGMTGCGKTEAEVSVEALLDPVGVELDVEEVKRGEFSDFSVYNAEIVPYVEELQFTIDGTFETMNVSVGEWVEEGQILATLSEEQLLEDIEELEESIANTIALGEYADRQAQLDIEIAQVELEMQREGGVSAQTCRLKEVDIQKIQLNMEQAKELRQLELQDKQKQLRGLKEKLGKSQIVAPFEGRIVYANQVKKGTSVQAYTTLICLADDSRLSLSSEYISESEILNADSICARIGDTDYDITYVPHDKDEYVAMVLAGEEIKTKFSIDAGSFEAGCYAAILVNHVTKEDVLTVPSNALYMDGSGRYVYKVVDGQRIRCNVAIGLSTDVKVEILDGVEEGDMVYVKE